MPMPRPSITSKHRCDATRHRVPATSALLLATLTLGACATDSAPREPLPNAPRESALPEFGPAARNAVDLGTAGPAAPSSARDPVGRDPVGRDPVGRDPVDLPTPSTAQGARFLADPEEPLTRARAGIAADLGAALAQAIAIHTRVVQAERDDERPFSRAYLAALVERGVGVRYVAGDQGAWHLSHEHASPSDTGEFEVRLSAGPVTVSRAYRIAADDEEATALSALTVTGSRAPIDPDTGAVKSAAFANRITYTDPPTLDGPAPLISLLDAPHGAPLARGGPSMIGRVENVEVENLFHSSDPFAGIESTHRRIDRHVVVFANDSLFLGSDNRSLLYRFVDKTVEEGDQLMLIGCSNGPTDFEGGNEPLALGRSTRVSDALAAVGIDRRRIDQEGCWAGSADPKGLPGRGVVLDVWRPRTDGGAS